MKIMEKIKSIFCTNKCVHPSLSVTIVFMFNQYKKFYINKEKTLKSFSLLLFKTLVIIEYLQVFFFTYNIIGRSIIVLSGILLMASTSEYVNLTGLFVIGYYISCCVMFYIMMQLPITQCFMIEILGKDAFRHYVGENPATKSMQKAGIVILSSYAAGLLAKAGHQSLDTLDVEKRLKVYVDSCVAAGLEPDPATLSKLACHRYDHITFKWFPDILQHSSIMEHSTDVAECVSKITEF